MEYERHEKVTTLHGREYKVVERLKDQDTDQKKYVIHCESSGESYYGTESELKQFLLGTNGVMRQLDYNPIDP
jgi:hypothetical protein